METVSGAAGVGWRMERSSRVGATSSLGSGCFGKVIQRRAAACRPKVRRATQIQMRG